MLVELARVEQRIQAVLEVLNDGASVTDVARRCGVARQRSLGMSLSDYAQIKNAGTNLAVVGALRFEHDPISPCERMTTVQD